MEKLPDQEGMQEKMEKEDVLEILRSKGLGDPEAMEMVMKWTMEQEELVTKENTSRAAIVFNIERSDLYIAAGDMEGAIDCLEDALTQAFQEDEKELYDQVLEKINELKSGRG